MTGRILMTLCEVALVYVAGVMVVIYADTTVGQRMMFEDCPDFDRILKRALRWPLWAGRGR